MSDKTAAKNSTPEPDAVRAFYNQFTTERSRNYAKNGNLRTDKALARILPLVREDSQILEIGCGAGTVTEQIACVAGRGFVSACDISDSAIVLARNRVKATHVQFQAFDVGSQFEQLKAWLPAPVELVVMVDVLEHVPLDQHGKLFQNLAAIMQPESRMVLTFPSANYQSYLRNHRPTELQIIDETIELPHLHEVALKNGFAIKHFSLEDVWLPNQYVHCVLTRGAVDYFASNQNKAAISEIANLIQPGEQFILVEQDEWLQKAPPGRFAIPFLEREGIYWGPPADDATAIAECERLLKAGAGYIVFGWPGFWWLEHYAGFHRHLRERCPCLIENERIIVFQLPLVVRS
jgi:SAM-dependent methyltransferase